MFDRLTERLDAALKKMTGRGRIREADVDEAMREVRRALLEADVNFKVARSFIAAVRERAVGKEVRWGVARAPPGGGKGRGVVVGLLGGGRGGGGGGGGAGGSASGALGGSVRCV